MSDIPQRDPADINLAVLRNILKNAQEDVDRAQARLDETKTKRDALLAEIEAASPPRVVEHEDPHATSAKGQG